MLAEITDCPIHTQACHIHFSDQTKQLRDIEFDIQPKPIQQLVPIHLRVTTGSMPVTQISVEIRGYNMDMGKNITRLQAKHTGIYTGVTHLSMCIRNKMVWQAVIKITSKGILYKIPVRFITHKHRQG